jgi:Raf kinase inhibitor-like YbhB/YbcL family protein
MQLKSSAFTNNGSIPSTYTCDGEDINPPLEFVNVPEDAQSLVLIVEDFDSVGKNWVHWILINIDPKTTHIREDSVPEGAIECITDFGDTGYGGPCPASGPHRYSFKLYALDAILDVTEDVTREEIEHVMQGRIIEKAELIGIYSRE